MLGPAGRASDGPARELRDRGDGVGRGLPAGCDARTSAPLPARPRLSNGWRPAAQARRAPATEPPIFATDYRNQAEMPQDDAFDDVDEAVGVFIGPEHSDLFGGARPDAGAVGERGGALGHRRVDIEKREMPGARFSSSTHKSMAPLRISASNAKSKASADRVRGSFTVSARGPITTGLLGAAGLATRQMARKPLAEILPAR